MGELLRCQQSDKEYPHLKLRLHITSHRKGVCGNEICALNKGSGWSSEHIWYIVFLDTHGNFSKILVMSWTEAETFYSKDSDPFPGQGLDNEVCTS